MYALLDLAVAMLVFLAGLWLSSLVILVKRFLDLHAGACCDV